MDQERPKRPAGDWSINLEDPIYAGNRERIVKEALDAVRQTSIGHYVNVVTHADCGDPGEWLIPRLPGIAGSQIRLQGDSIHRSMRLRSVQQSGTPVDGERAKEIASYAVRAYHILSDHFMKEENVLFSDGPAIAVSR